MSERQWFVKINPDEIQKAAHEVSVDPRTHAPPDGELGRTDGMGLVHLPAADFCHPDPGLVLQKVRRDGSSRMRKTSPSTRPR